VPNSQRTPGGTSSARARNYRIVSEEEQAELSASALFSASSRARVRVGDDEEVEEEGDGIFTMSELGGRKSLEESKPRGRR
jgi:hypothetical protein